MLSLHFTERILESHAASEKNDNDASSNHYQNAVIGDEGLGECQCENGNDSEQRIHHTGPQTGHETGLMPLTEGFLQNKNRYRSERNRSAHSYEKALQYVEKH